MNGPASPRNAETVRSPSPLIADRFAALFCIPRGLPHGSIFPLPRPFSFPTFSLSLSRSSPRSSAFRKLKRAYNGDGGNGDTQTHCQALHCQAISSTTNVYLIFVLYLYLSFSRLKQPFHDLSHVLSRSYNTENLAPRNLDETDLLVRYVRGISLSVSSCRLLPIPTSRVYPAEKSHMLLEAGLTRPRQEIDSWTAWCLRRPTKLESTRIRDAYFRRGPRPLLSLSRTVRTNTLMSVCIRMRT